jgi:plastocyanin
MNVRTVSPTVLPPHDVEPRPEAASYSVTHFSTRALLFSALAVLLLALSGTAPAAVVDVQVGHDVFEPSSVLIQVGDTVTWTWTTDHTSSVTSGKNNTPNGLFDSGIKLAPYTFSYTFNTEGQFDYFCRVDPVNMVGRVTVSASLPPAQPLNISTRLAVQTGENVMIGGFIITGNALKKVIVRGIGPSLAQAGVSNALADPVIDLKEAGGSPIASNDNWKETQPSEIQASGVAPQNTLESAIVATLTPGGYTAIVSGKNGTAGVALAEVYDLTQDSDSMLANISTRGLVQAGSNVMIGGFILGKGGASARVVVRAIGPSLAQAGVSGALADPTLELHDGNGATLSSNDNWQDTQKAEIEASGIAPKNAAESAIVALLPPGSYTAIAAGKGGTAGVALVEVYRLP